MKTTSFHSRKNTFRAEILYSECLQFGNVSSFTAMDIDELKSFVEQEVRRLRMSGYRALTAEVTISENKASYPKFDWQTIKKYTI